MDDLTLEETIDLLTTESPSYATLLSVYHSLQAQRDVAPDRLVARKAIAQVVGEIIEYLNFVSDDLEKSIGLTREAERRRVLEALNEPPKGGVIDRTSSLIAQWEDLEKYSLRSPEEGLFLR